MNLPEGLKQAVAIGAHEVLLEWLPSVIADPQAVLDGNDLGSTYQPFLDEGAMPEADAQALLVDLAAWDPGDDGSAAVFPRLDASMLHAAIDIARALITLATGAGQVPPAVAPFAHELAPLVDVVKQAVAGGSFDDDVQSLIW